MELRRMKALITGGTSGLGYGAARQLIESGWDVTIVGRNVQSGTQTAEAMGARFLQADLSLMSEVYRLASTLEGPLDALVMCAGVVSTQPIDQRTTEGYELTFATNYLGKFVLSQLLLPKMTPEGCIVMVGGDGQHKGVSTDWSTYQSGLRAARMASLAVDLFAAELAKHEPHLRIHTCYPGIVKTNLLQDAPWLMKLYVQILGSSIARGSSYIINLVTQPHQGVHWNKDKPMTFSPSLPTDIHQLLDYSQTVFEKHVKEYA
jgi:NAD(P)-dependent dehydrogenase (short-subunit alcohol dehydrogenase family)